MKKAKPIKAKTQADYAKEALEVIESKKIAFIDHVWGFTTFSKKTAYNHGLHELHDIREALDRNRSSAKGYMLNKWIKSDNPTLQVAAMRLLSDTEEHKKLNQHYTDLTSNGSTLKAPPIQWVDGDDE